MGTHLYHPKIIVSKINKQKVSSAFVKRECEEATAIITTTIINNKGIPINPLMYFGFDALPNDTP
jgi:hypothetical protein